ncbi:hypothetical protein BG005_006371 [Podila minutissima]|nr:hypothetical protein BG005_006371 [Podila minutissima]
MSVPFKIIVGGGVGLMTAIQLERADMDYVVLEKARAASPLGSASLTPSCSYIFDQRGDACHKHLPFGGQEANQSILDSVHIVNQLYDIPSNSLEDIEKSFKAFDGHRSPAKEDFQPTFMVASTLSKKPIIHA